MITFCIRFDEDRELWILERVQSEDVTYLTGIGPSFEDVKRQLDTIAESAGIKEYDLHNCWMVRGDKL